MNTFYTEHFQWLLLKLLHCNWKNVSTKLYFICTIASFSIKKFIIFLFAQNIFCILQLLSHVAKCNIGNIFRVSHILQHIRNEENVMQIFHAFLFNITNYSPEVINIPRREDEFNIMLPRVNNFVIKQKRHGIFCSLNKIWENKG